MSDGGGIKANIGQFAADVGEALVDPVKDSVGEAIEQGVQAVVPTQKPIPQDPQEAQKQQQDQAKKQEENAKNLQWANQTIARYEKIEEEIAQIRMKKKQEEQQKQQEEQQEKQVKGFELQQQNQKSADLTALQNAKARTETKGGVGG